MTYYYNEENHTLRGIILIVYFCALSALKLIIKFNKSAAELIQSEACNVNRKVFC